MRNGSAILQWSFPSSRRRICIREPKEKAAGYLRQGQEIMERLAKLSPENAQWSQDLAWFGRKLAEVTEDQPSDNKTGQARPPPDAEKTVPARRDGSDN
jgi:hypothetical protein